MATGQITEPIMGELTVLLNLPGFKGYASNLENPGRIKCKE